MKYIQYYSYLVFENGDIWSNKLKRYLKPETTKHGYKQVTLSVNKRPYRIRVHRLVALLFIGEPPFNKTCVNHIDGNKENNHFSNLEWCDYYENNKHAREFGLNNISKSNSDRWKDEEFRRKTSKNISNGVLASGCNAGENNPRFRYKIFDNSGRLYNRKELAEELGYAQSTIDSNIKRCALNLPNLLTRHGFTVVDINVKV